MCALPAPHRQCSNGITLRPKSSVPATKSSKMHMTLLRPSIDASSSSCLATLVWLRASRGYGPASTLVELASKNGLRVVALTSRTRCDNGTKQKTNRDDWQWARGALADYALTRTSTPWGHWHAHWYAYSAAAAKGMSNRGARCLYLLLNCKVLYPYYASKRRLDRHAAMPAVPGAIASAICHCLEQTGSCLAPFYEPSLTPKMNDAPIEATPRCWWSVRFSLMTMGVYPKQWRRL